MDSGRRSFSREFRVNLLEYLNPGIGVGALQLSHHPAFALGHAPKVPVLDSDEIPIRQGELGVEVDECEQG